MTIFCLRPFVNPGPSLFIGSAPYKLTAVFVREDEDPNILN